MDKKILAIGNCSHDHSRLAKWMEHHYRATVVSARHTEEAIERLRADRYDLVLVNRIFDEDGEEGLDAIRRMKADPEFAQTPVMLMSNFHEYQMQALAA